MKFHIFFLVVLFLLLPTGCSSSSSPTDASPATDGRTSQEGLAGDGRGGDAGRKDGLTITDILGDGPGQTDAQVPVGNWSIVATQSSVELENGQLALHPTLAQTLAVKLEVSPFSPDVAVAVSSDYGQTIQTVTVKAYTNPQPGHYDDPLGFGYDPTSGQKLALMTEMPPSGSPPYYDSLVFATSTNGGLSFTVSQLQTNPWPPDGMKFVAGKTSNLAIRSQQVLYQSSDLGQTLSTVFSDSSLCLAHGDFAVSPTDPSVFLMTCDSTLVRCEKKVCSKAQIPTGFTATRVEFCPHDATWVMAASYQQVIRSADGGKSFSVAGTFQGIYKILFDPRPGKSNFYIFCASGSKLYRSTDGGKTYSNVTPPSTLKPPYGTYLRDVGVAADGAVIGLAHPGVIRLPPP